MLSHARAGWRRRALSHQHENPDAGRAWNEKKDTATIALPATGDAIVGGVIGGKKGAAIGAAAGGGTGTAAVLSTRGKEVCLGRAVAPCYSCG